MEVPNFGKKDARFVSNIPKFIEFLNKAKLTGKLHKELKNTLEPSKNKKASVNKEKNYMISILS